MTGDELAGLYDTVRPRLQAWTAKIVGRQDAEEVVADTFEAAWKSRANAPQDPDGRVGWLFGIARKKAMQFLDHRHRKHLDRPFLTDNAADAARVDLAADPATLVTDRLSAQAVRSELTESERVLFDLNFLHGWPADQVESLLGITHGAHATRLSRLRQRIERLNADITAKEELP